MLMTHPHCSEARFLALRLPPGADMLSALQEETRRHNLQAAYIAGCVGSLSRAVLRYAGRPEAGTLTGDFEIVSLCGTLDAAGAHVHLAIADAQGRMRGGHALTGCRVRTTLEIVLGELADLRFTRALCPLSGYDELVVSPR